MCSKMKIAEEVKHYIVNEILDAQARLRVSVNDETPLIRSGILDSLGVLKLVAFVVQRYSLEIPESEYNIDSMETVATVVTLVERFRKPDKPPTGLRLAPTST